MQTKSLEDKREERIASRDLVVESYSTLVAELRLVALRFVDSSHLMMIFHRGDAVSRVNGRCIVGRELNIGKTTPKTFDIEQAYVFEKKFPNLTLHLFCQVWSSKLAANGTSLREKLTSLMRVSRLVTRSAFALDSLILPALEEDPA